MTGGERLGPEMEYDLDPTLFKAYVRANSVIPQVSDGIKWVMHHAFFQNPVPLKEMAYSRFSNTQLADINTKTNAIHNATGIPFISVGSTTEPSLPEGVTPIFDQDFQTLWKKVPHSLVNNLYHYERVMNGEVELPNIGYKSDAAHDLEVPSIKMVNTVEAYLRSGTDGLGTYTSLLRVMNGCLDSDEGKKMLARYRQEFRNGMKGGRVWRRGGYGDQYAVMVRDAIDTEGFDKRAVDVRAFLQIYNIDFYAAFTA